MPERMFRPLMAGSVLDFTVIDSLAREFMVSKHACSFRILDFIRDPYAVITSSGYSVTTLKTSRSGRGYLPELKTIPQDTAAHVAIAHKVRLRGGWQGPYLSNTFMNAHAVVFHLGGDDHFAVVGTRQ